MLGFVVLLAKILFKYLDNKKLLGISLISLVVIGVGFTFIFKLFEEMPINVVYALDTGILLIAFVLGIYTYKKTQDITKANLYFYTASIAFFIFFKAACIALPFMALTSPLYGFVSITKFTFLIPAVILATVSSKIFEPRAS